MVPTSVNPCDTIDMRQTDVAIFAGALGITKCTAVCTITRKFHNKVHTVSVHARWMDTMGVTAEMSVLMFGMAGV